MSWNEPIGLPEFEGEVSCDAEAVGDPLACEPSDDVIRDSGLLTHRMFPDDEIRSPPRIDRPADGQPGPDPDCARGRPNLAETAAAPGERNSTLEDDGRLRRFPGHSY
jgi:hypothetical protein